MTLKLAKPTGAKLVLRKELPVDADAAAYIAAVEAADGQALESGVKFAITNFVLCCKQDGIWPAIKASCILAGARTLSGALVPLVGTAPTNFNFVSGDYNRKTGLVGNGSTKYLNSNRNNNADPQNNKHLSVFRTVAGTTAAVRTDIGTPGSGTQSCLLYTGTSAFNRINNSSTSVAIANPVAFWGTSRDNGASTSYRINGNTYSSADSSSAPGADMIAVFGRGGATQTTDARLAFYSIGESLDLALLDARVTDLINAFGAAIP